MIKTYLTFAYIRDHFVGEILKINDHIGFYHKATKKCGMGISIFLNVDDNIKEFKVKYLEEVEII